MASGAPGWVGVCGLFVVQLGVLSSSASAQNLVPNPSFESYTLCPTTYDQLNQAPPWSKPTGGSPDYFNACAGSPAIMGVPTNDVGSQAPHSGNAYAGFILRNSVSANYREYLEAQLTSPLTANVSYQVSFYVSLSDASQWGIDKIGAYLSVGAVGPVNNALPLPLTPQVANLVGNHITSKSAWTPVTGTYVAAGGENYVVIGNFYNDASTTPVVGLGGFYTGAYYYIDDVSVSTLNCEPLPDGSGCTESCTNPDAACRPSKVIDNLSTGETTVIECGCDCFMRRNDVPPFEPLFCTGGTCQSTGRPCELTSTPNHDGTTTYDCCGAPSCAPNVAKTACQGTCPPVGCPANPPGTTPINQCGTLEDGLTSGCVIFRSQGGGSTYEVLNPAVLAPFGIGEKLRICGYVNNANPTTCQQGLPIVVNAVLACDAGENCQPRCLRKNLSTGQIQVVDCECRGPEPCRAVLGEEGVDCLGRCPQGKGCHRTQTGFTDAVTGDAYLDVCCDCEDVCPLQDPPLQYDPCAGFQSQYCVDGGADDTCLPHCAMLASNHFCPPIPPYVNGCDCACAAPDSCGPVSVTGVGQPYFWNNLPFYRDYLFSCPGDCLPPDVGVCKLFHKGMNASTFSPTALLSALASQLAAGYVKCGCAEGPPPPCEPNAAGTACQGVCSSGVSCKPTAVTCTGMNCVITDCACIGNTCHAMFPPTASGTRCAGTCPTALFCVSNPIVNPDGSTTHACGCGFQAGYGDFDSDGDIDLRDISHFQNCFQTAGGQVPPACSPADLEPDNDVDLADFARVHQALICAQ